MIDKKEILDLYSIYVQTITANEQRRLQVSVFYLSLVVAGTALLGVIKLKSLFVIVPVFIISLIWFFSIKYFRSLANAKFKVISEMESHFSIRPFEMERTHYKGADKDDEQAKVKKKLRLSLTHLDMLVPLAVMLASGVYLLFEIISIIPL